MSDDAQPAAWIDFADNGNIRFWTTDPARARAEKDSGRHLRMFTLAELVALSARPRSAHGPLKTAVAHLEHMALWITAKNDGYSFEGFGEDMPGIRDAIAHAEADKARLDFLDEANRRLNAYSGTTYRWKLIFNHLVNRLMLGHLAVDLNDQDERGHHSCRSAIDEEILRVERDRKAS